MNYENPTTPDTPDLPQDVFAPVMERPYEIEHFLGREITLCFYDLDGTHDFITCYGDICKIVNALMDYARLLEMVCDQWNLQHFHRATYEYQANKLREIAVKYQAVIGYDYEAAIEKCRKKKAKSNHSDVGEDALALAVHRRQQADKPRQTSEAADKSVNELPPWQEEEYGE